jgi:hypothetical protein
MVIIQWLRRLFVWVIALMTGLFSLVREFQGIYGQKVVLQKPLFEHCVFIAFISSAAYLWFVERKKVRELEKERKENAPKLSAEIKYCCLSECGLYDEDLMVVLYLTIKNSGAPSVVDNFELFVRSGPEDVVGISRSLTPGSYISTSSALLTDDRIELTPDIYLPTMGLQNPIPYGGAITGYYSAIIYDTKSGDISFDSVIGVIFHDVAGKEYRIEQAKLDISYCSLW